jgi:hypothetical protein
MNWRRTKTTVKHAWFGYNIQEKDVAFLAVYVVDVQGTLVSLILATYLHI